MRKVNRSQAIAHAKYRDRKRLVRLRKTGPTDAIEKWKAVSPVDVVRAPRYMYLHGRDSHEAHTAFLSYLRKSFQKSGITTVIDLDRVERLMPAGTLLFFAELSRLKTIYPHKSFKFIRSKNDTVNQVLEHLKVYSLANYVSGAVPEREDVVTWRAATSTITDGRPAGELIETYESLSRAEIRHIFRGVSEAATNAVEHAYVDRREDGINWSDESRWWMFCRESESRLYVAVCDLGIGIPRSLPRTYSEEVVSLLLKTLSLGSIDDDAAMIRAAMEVARTRTEKDERGKGLGDMKQVVDSLPNSRLHIFSNRGMVSYENGHFSSRLYKNSILGTMVVWIIPIESEQ